MSTSNAQAASKDYAAFIPEIWSTKLVKLLHDSCVALQCVNRNYEGEIKNAGDTVHIRSFSTVSMSIYDGSISDEQYETPTPVEQELVIDQKYMFGFKVDDVSKAQSDINIMNGYLTEAKKAADELQDTFVLGKHADVPAGNTVGTLTTPITLTKDNVYSTMVTLARKLKDANAIEGNGMKPWVIINPLVEELLLNTTQFTQATASGDATLRNGSIGKVAGLDVLVSTNFDAVNGKYYIMAGTNEAITFASQVVKVETLKDKSFFGDLVRGLYLYGAKTVQPACLAKVIATIST